MGNPLADELAEALAVDVTTLTVAEFVGHMARVEQLRTRFEARVYEALAAFDRSAAWQVDAAYNTANWLAAQTGSARTVAGCPKPASTVSFTSMREVKNRRRGTTRVSSKHQVTIPTDALRAAGLEVGERLTAHADGPGRVVFERETDVLAEFAGALTGVYERDELSGLRDEWD